MSSSRGESSSPSRPRTSLFVRAARQFRRWVLTFHLWMTFLAGLFVVVTSTTGAISVFYPELDAVFRPALHRKYPGPILPADEVAAKVTQAVPGSTVIVLQIEEETNVYTLFLRPPNRRVFVDGTTGKILAFDDTDRGLAQLILRFHVSLMSTGNTGIQIVGVIGIALILLSVSGLWLWWPGFSGLRSTFQLRLKRGLFLASYDSHRFLGLISAPLLMVVAFTGICLCLPQFMQPAIHRYFGKQLADFEHRMGVTVPPEDRPRISLARVLEVSRTVVSDPAHTQIYTTVPPANSSAPYRVFVMEPEGYGHLNGRHIIMVHPYSGAILDQVEPASLPLPTQFFDFWLQPLHYGTYGGIGLRLAYFIAGMMPLVLAATGLLMWWNKRAKKRKAPA